MDRILKIVFYTIFLIILFLGINGVLKSSKNTSSEMKEKEEFSLSGQEDENKEFFGEDSGDASSLDQTIEHTVQNNDDLFEEAEITFDEPIEEKTTPYEEEARPSPTFQSEKPTPKKSYGSVQNGKYLIIAGNFLVQENASQMARRLQNLGYENAELVTFDASDYHTVCAARFEDYNQAVSLSSRLKSQGIDNYVHTQQF